eukprot:TRINITY_DN11561_c0_g1_i1.p1 TRINITY_DN11561_c0_g1~~TRINITY_DN11561_c0_g1_i1.p1  ORF type:complete len:489 (-),score=118.79 TRINITY_DN11561_c0_g1_i1:173-1639(-)
MSTILGFKKETFLLMVLMVLATALFTMFCLSVMMAEHRWIHTDLAEHRIPFAGEEPKAFEVFIESNTHDEAKTTNNQKHTSSKTSPASEYKKWLKKQIRERKLHNVSQTPLDQFYSFDNNDETLSDDVTLLFGIINIGRKAHLGKEGKEYTFEGDYVQQLISILRFVKPQPAQVIIQRQYFDLIKPHLYEKAVVRFVEVEDLRNFKHYKEIEAIRQSSWWVPATPWLISVPQGYSDLYNPLVMQKVLWLRDLVASNPFKTKHFMWLDSGGICTPGIRGLGLDKFLKRAKNYMSRGFLITATAYAQSDEIHGCQRTLMAKVLNGLHPAFVTKGWLMGGTGESVINVANAYEVLLKRLLRIGCLGTEETVFTTLQYIRPKLFSFYYNGDKRGPWQGGFCDIIYDTQEDSVESAMTSLLGGMDESQLAPKEIGPPTKEQILQDVIEEEMIYNSENDPDSMESIRNLPQERFMKKIRESWEGTQSKRKDHNS